MDDRIRLPNISAGTPEGSIEQIKSYLKQLALQLDRILESGGSGGSVGQSEDAQTMFSRIMPLIIQSKEIADNLKQKLSGSFADADDIKNYVLKFLKPSTYGVWLGMTGNDGQFIQIMHYSPTTIVFYQSGEQVMSFENNSLSVVGSVWADSFNGVYMRSAEPKTDGKIRIKTKFDEFGKESGNQCFFIFGREGGMQFTDIISVSGAGSVECGHLAFVEAEGFGSIVISDNLDICVIFSPEFFQII
jgi:hypothetical protein